MGTNAGRLAPAPLFERDAELATLGHALAAGAQGEGRLVVVEGPAGIGKSRLLDATAELAVEAAHVVVRTRGGELETSHALGVATRLADSVAGAFDEDVLAGALRGRAALARPLLGRHADAGPERTADEFGLFDALYWLLANLAESAPIAVLVDDVQWADDPSTRFINFLAERLDDVAVTLVVAVRTGDPAAERAGVHHLLTLGSADERIRPAELSPDAVEAWLLAACRHPAPNDLVQASWDACAGNPFLLSELIAMYHGARRRPEPQEVASVAPDRVRRRAVLRLAAFGSEAEQLAKAAAILGDDATVGRVRELADVPAGRALAVIEQLVAAQILDLRPDLRFRHPLIRQAVYQGCAAGERPRLHRDAARMLHTQGADPEVVCRHLLAAPPVDEPWAIDALSRGARTAIERGVPSAAATYLRTALDRITADRWDPDLLIRLGSAEAACGEPTSLERFEQALERIDEPVRYAEALAALGETQFRCGRQAEAAETFRRGASLLADLDPPRARELEAAYMCAALYVDGIHDDAMARLEEIAEAIGDRDDLDMGERVLLSVLALHRAMTTPRAADAAALARRAFGNGELLTAHASVPLGAHIAAFALSCCGAARDAQPLVAEALKTAGATGDALAFAELSLTSGLLAWSRGQVSDAAADAQAAIRAMHQGWQGFGPMAHGILAQALIERGAVDEARSVIDEAIAGAMSSPEIPGPNAWIFVARGYLHLAEGRPSDALDDFFAAEAGRLALRRDQPRARRLAAWSRARCVRLR